MTSKNPSANDPPPDIATLRSKSVRGGVVTLASQAGTVAIQLTSAVILARLLGPEEFGVVAMVLAVTAFAGMFRDLGLSAPTIQNDRLSQDQLTVLFWVNIAAGMVLTIVVGGCAPLVAWFYDRSELTWVTLALSPIFVIGSVGAQSAALLTRDMRFGRLAIANIGGPLVNLIVAAVLAWQGFSYWALVSGSLAGILMRSVLYVALSGSRFRLPRRTSGIRSLLAFGGNVTAFDVINYFARNMDSILIGRVWGASALGLYNRAYQLLMFPIINLRGPINAVAFPAMSKLKNDPVEYRRYYRGVNSLLAFLSMPLTAFLFVASDPIIRVLLGSDWTGAVPIYSTLALVAFIQPCGSTIGLVCLSRGMGRRFFLTGFAAACLTVGGFFVGIQWGPIGIAWAYVTTTYLGILPCTAWAFHSTPLRLADFLQGLRRPAVASILAGAGVFALLPYLAGMAAGIAIAISLPVFAALYFLLLILQPGGRKELERIIRVMREARLEKRQEVARLST